MDFARMTLSVTLQHDFGSFILDASFEAPTGITVLFGRSGSGKTTIINAVAGLLRPRVGRVATDSWVLGDTSNGVWLPAHKRRLGYIFQEGRLFPHLSVRQNLAYGRRFAPKDAPREDMGRVIDLLGLGHLLDRRPGYLSGGEKQRVAIGRALLAAPRLILADEPLASLDEARKAEILPYFERLRDEVSVPILYVSHSPFEVARLATTVVAMEKGQVSHKGTAAEVLGDPMATFAGPRGVGAVLEAVVEAHHPDGLSELDAAGTQMFLPKVNARVGNRVRIRIAAHEVVLSLVAPQAISALNVFAGTITSIRPGLDPGTIVSVRTSAGPVLAHVTRRSLNALALSEGMGCYAIVKSLAVAPEDVGGAG
ncbi:MAG: molybdenum ABC transporter ATP-binding protein [Nitrococcus sp.]|nr:molybdenum ABC transporter ATP-binding protein [Nitrococcus sp.]